MKWTIQFHEFWSSGQIDAFEMTKTLNWNKPSYILDRMLLRMQILEIIFIVKTVVSTVMSGILFARFPTVDYITQM